MLPLYSGDVSSYNKHLSMQRKFTFFHFLTALIAVLLLVLGGVIGFRYGLTGSLPFNLEKIIQVPADNMGLSSSLARVIGSKEPKRQLNNEPVDFDIFWEVWSLLERDYLEPDKIDAAKMVDGAIGGMTASLGDPYTMYLPPEDNERSAEDLAGSFYGVGIELGYLENTLAVVAPIKDGPAEKLGVKAGDLIVHAKDQTKSLDEDTTGWSLDQAVKNIRGKRGTQITLTLVRTSEGDRKPFEVSITRDEIIVKSVTLEFVEQSGKRVAHLKLAKFGERTMDEWDEAVKQITAQRKQIAGIVLDLRNNPGGFFDTSIEVASDFVKKDVVVSQQGRVRSQNYSSNGKGRLNGIPLIVLVNRGSASASEIVAGALRDDLGVKLVGEKTFGKGTVQDRRELSNGGGLHITIGRWLLPKGSWIHKEGIPVDIEVKDDAETEADEVLIKAAESL